jgi:hypothetical protein
VKAEEAFGILIARKMVDNQVRFLPHPPVSRAVRYNFLLTSDLRHWHPGTKMLLLQPSGRFRRALPL